jgi:hypothetical protein
MANRIGLSEEGKDFLVACLDPMHDNLLPNLKGWPDVESAPSVIRCFKQSMTVAVPAGVGAVPWDCHINGWPFLEGYSSTTYNRSPAPAGGNNAVVSVTAPTNANPIGGVTAYGLATGNNFVLGAAQTFLANSMNSTPFNLTDVGRVIGYGIEVVNTTAPINAQGTATVYRQPLGHSIPSTFTLPGTTEHGFCTATVMSAPPNNLQEAMLLSGTRQWKAVDGAYVVAAFLGQDNPPMSAAYTQPWFVNGALDTDVVAVVNSSPCFGPIATVVGGILAQPWVMPAIRMHPIHMPGIIMSGLSATSTLTVNWNVFYETFPNTSSDLVTLARPSCVYDSMALHLLSSILSDIPVGVQSEDNWDGEWWANVVEKLSGFAPAIGAALGGPAGAALGTAMSGAGVALGSYLRAPGDTSGKGRGKKKPPGQPQKAKQQQSKAVPVQVVYETAARNPSRKPRQRRKRGGGTNSNMQTRVASF